MEWCIGIMYCNDLEFSMLWLGNLLARSRRKEHTLHSWQRTLTCVASLCDIAHCGREELHHFLPVLLRGMLPLFNIMTLCSAPTPHQAPVQHKYNLRSSPELSTLPQYCSYYFFTKNVVYFVYLLLIFFLSYFLKKIFCLFCRYDQTRYSDSNFLLWIKFWSYFLPGDDIYYTGRKYYTVSAEMHWWAHTKSRQLSCSTACQL